MEEYLVVCHSIGGYTAGMRWYVYFTTKTISYSSREVMNFVDLDREFMNFVDPNRFAEKSSVDEAQFVLSR